MSFSNASIEAVALPHTPGPTDPRRHVHAPLVPPVPEVLHRGIDNRDPVLSMTASRAPRIGAAQAWSPLSATAAPAKPACRRIRSRAADSARTVSTWGRRRSPRSRVLTAWTDRPAIVASSSYVNPAASRSALSCAPNDARSTGFHGDFILLPAVRASYGSCAGAVGGDQLRSHSHSRHGRPHTGSRVYHRCRRIHRH